ncbi:hypothetical protein [Nocardioides currus]|uniref:Uncharacterized protein n=1 Tax=Nocardioides currus TaxID=2133958 RepID=A0A2R7Z1M3_9ACTN|nr:hypothetical protein [Nocardioides currus]PUA82510.1 hypothetical protein C7S10_01855 [Nocardioides currus]
MDLSALIFVALAVAWAVYLIPKALKHHDEVVRSRSVDRFSQTMRVLARREPVSRRDARLVVTPGRQPSAATVETKASSAPVTQPSYAARRAAARQATRRRRNVLGAILLVNAIVVGLAVAHVVTWPWVSVPAGLLVAWLVACRVMVKGERAAARPVTAAAQGTAPAPSAVPVDDGLPETTDSPLVADVEAEAPAAEPVAESHVEPHVAAPARAEGAWDMVPTTLPTYVSKPAAVRRTVQTIDLDSTGVWSSGRNDDDSALAREAEESERTERTAREAAERRAFGS